MTHMVVTGKWTRGAEGIPDHRIHPAGGPGSRGDGGEARVRIADGAGPEGYPPTGAASRNRRNAESSVRGARV